MNNEEKGVLRDVAAKTGLHFESLAGIDTHDSETASAVLPILASWVPQIRSENIRAAIYHRFSQNAQRYLFNMLDWWEHETDSIALSFLTYSIAGAIQSAADARDVWMRCDGAENKPFFWLLLSKLSRFSNISEQVKGRIVAALMQGTVPSWELQSIAKVRDSRVLEWFSHQLNSPDKRVRTVAQRLVSKKTALPMGVRVDERGPDDILHIFSMDIDLDELPGAIKAAAKQLNLSIPAALKRPGFLSGVALNSWINVDVASKSGPGVTLWFGENIFDSSNGARYDATK